METTYTVAYEPECENDPEPWVVIEPGEVNWMERWATEKQATRSAKSHTRQAERIARQNERDAAIDAMDAALFEG